MNMIITQVRIVDEEQDQWGTVLIQDGLIAAIYPENQQSAQALGFIGSSQADIHIHGKGLVLMPAFIEIHAHLREPGFSQKETVESGSLAAAAGGFCTLVCMANTNPVLDNLKVHGALRDRAVKLGLIDLFPVLSLTRGMAGSDVSHLTDLDSATCAAAGLRMLSEDGKDVEDNAIFSRAFEEAARLGLPVSCHCDAGGQEALEAKKQGLSRGIYSRIEENKAVERALELGAKAGAHVHIAHVSTKEAIESIKAAKKNMATKISCEATPHHLALTERDADLLGAESYGRVNPPLRSEEDRQALLEALEDGTIDALATDHAPHTEEDKAAGAPGFTGLETAFAVYNEVLVHSGKLGLRELSGLMSSHPARILGLQDRGWIRPGLRSDLVLVDTDSPWIIDTDHFKSRGKNSPFNGKKLHGRVVMTIHGGRIGYDGRQ